MRGKRIAIIAAFVIFVVIVSMMFVTVFAQDTEVSVTMPSIFQSGMVLQRNKPININGYSDNEGALITVELGDNVGTATVVNGEWCVTLPEMEAARGKTINVKDADGNIIKSFTDVSIGEVWVMTGQSNAALESSYLEDIDEYAALAEITDVRVYESSKTTSLLPNDIGYGIWERVKASDLRSKDDGISALGYVVAVKLAAELGGDVPVALVSAGRGASKIITWLDYATISEMSPSLKAAYDACVQSGSLPNNAHSSNAVASVMFNQVINPLRHYNVAGVMWYQGCGDTDGEYFGTDVNRKNYTDYFLALKELFRDVFGGDDTLPFYVMQLAPFCSDRYKVENIDAFKVEQYNMCDESDNTYLVSLASDGNAFTTKDADGGLFLHPSRKSTVGVRTAEMILVNEYDIKRFDVYSYPKVVSATRDSSGRRVILTFDTDLQYTYGDVAVGFELYDGSTWHKVTGKIEGNKLTLTAGSIKNYTKVRYGFGNTRILMNDGSEIEAVNGTATANSAEIKTPNNILNIPLNTTDVVMTKDDGNITNASGVPLPVFEMSVTAG